MSLQEQETLADVAYTAGWLRVKCEDSRELINKLIIIAELFNKLYAEKVASGEWPEDCYLGAVDEFAIEQFELHNLKPELNFYRLEQKELLQMKFYRLEWSDPDHGMRVEWFTSEVNAKKANTGLKKLKMAGTITPVDIPTTKNELVAWLNKNVQTDNG